MTGKQGEEALKRYWAIGLAIVSAAAYGVCAWIEEGGSKMGSLAALAGIGAAIKILIDRNKTDTQQSVKGVLNWESILAGLELQARLDAFEAHTNQRLEAHERKNDQRHTDNSLKFDAILRGSDENGRLHAEHIAVTDSHAEAITALGEVAAEVKPGFTLPKLHPRSKPPQ